MSSKGQVCSLRFETQTLLKHVWKETFASLWLQLYLYLALEQVWMESMFGWNQKSLEHDWNRGICFNMVAIVFVLDLGTCLDGIKSLCNMIRTKAFASIWLQLYLYLTLEHVWMESKEFGS